MSRGHFMSAFRCGRDGIECSQLGNHAQPHHFAIFNLIHGVLISFLSL